MRDTERHRKGKKENMHEKEGEVGEDPKDKEGKERVV